MSRFHRWSLLLFLTLLLLLSLSCNLLSQQTLNATIPSNPTEDPQAIQTQVQAAVTLVSSGERIVLEFTEGQLTAAANREIQNQGLEDIRDLQIGLADGMVIVSGQVNQNGLNLPLFLSLSIHANEQGIPVTEVNEGKLGPFPLPQNILDQLKVKFDQILQAEINAAYPGVFIENININKGSMTILAESR